MVRAHLLLAGLRVQGPREEELELEARSAMTILIDLPYPPTLNSMYRNVVIGGFARTLLSKAARAYKQSVADVCTAERIKPLAGPVELRLVAYRPSKRGDLDGVLKALCDALQGYCYENDNQIVCIMAWRRDDKDRPRVEVAVTPFGA